MWLIIVPCIIFLISNVSMATINNGRLNDFYPKDLCQKIGDECQDNSDCCSYLTCYSIEDKNLCLPSDKHKKRYADDFIIPPYYNPKNHLYPYGINMPPFPFYNAYEVKQSKSHQRNKMEWDHCQFHENCGEGNCCYVHFRFRSLPKSFCRPNRNNKSDLCEPLTKYRSLKDVPAWKQQQKQQQQSYPLRTTYFGQ